MLRPILAQDKAAYLSMAHDFYHSDAVDHAVADSHLERTFDALMMGTPYASCRILEHNGEMAGYVLLAHTWSQEAGGETVWVEELYVLPQFRGNGLGKQTLAALEREYPKVSRFRLEVRPDNVRARQLYESLGYRDLDYLQMVQDKGCK